tara:strand:- start:8766 stop:9167 length:402 start_codon:yes stop_codon:yes gene_type:complete
MNRLYIFIAIFIYLILVYCLCQSISIIPYNTNIYTKISENFKVSKATNNYADSLGNKVKETTCKKVQGFNGLQCCPYSDFKTIDNFAFTLGNKECNGVGLFNSKGSLCLDKSQKKLLVMRGGNRKYPDSQIGP